MVPLVYTKPVLDRNLNHDRLPPETDLSRLTRGGREVYRRVRQSVPLCNAIASLAGIGGPVAER